METYESADKPSRASTRMAMLRARLDLPTVRRASGLFEGAHTSILKGHGHDFEDLVDYERGDDITDIDWKSSARAGHPIIRRFERQTDVFTQLVMDTSVDMRGAAPSGERKSEVALFAADLLGYLATSRGDQLGLVHGDSNGFKRFPARHGNAHLEFTLDVIKGALEKSTGRSAVSAMLEHILRLPQRRALLIVITDEFWPASPEDTRTIRRLRTLHELLVVRVADMQVTQEGIAHMKDVVSGDFIPAFLREDAVLAKELAETRTEAVESSAETLRSLGIRNAVVDSTDDVVPTLFKLLRRRNA